MSLSRKQSNATALTEDTHVESPTMTRHTMGFEDASETDIHRDNASKTVDNESSNDSSDVSDVALRQQGRDQQKCKVPLEVQVVIGILIPIAFLFVVSGQKVLEAVTEKNFIEKHRNVITTTSECEDALLRERLWSTRCLYPAFLIGTQEYDDLTTLGEAREVTDIACAAAKAAAAESDDPDISTVHTVTGRREWELLIEARYRVLHGLIDGSEVRDIYTDLFFAASAPVPLIAKHAPLSAIQLIQLWTARFIANALGLVRDVGLDLLIQTKLSNMTMVNMKIQNELLRARAYYNRTLSELAVQRQPEGESYLESYLNSGPTAIFITFAAIMETGDYSQVAYVGPPYWITLASRPLEVLILADAVLQSETLKYEKINKDFQTYLIVLIAAMLCSAIATAWIIYEQHQATKRMNITHHRVLAMQRAATSFVPRTFLKLMGCTSITHVTAGDATNVAMTLVSCRIREFTLLSEAMSSEELFKWLQDYFGRMTRVVEKHDGFIDKIIGDSMLAVFQSAVAGVQCSIAIQGTADIINVERIQKRSEHLVSLGIGINSCVVSAGIMGSKLRKEPAIVSSEVRVAGELEALSGTFGVRIIVSGETFEQCIQTNFEHRKIGTVDLSGKKVQLVEIFQSDSLQLKKFKKLSAVQLEAVIQQLSRGNVQDCREAMLKLKKQADELHVVDGVVDAILVNPNALANTSQSAAPQESTSTNHAA